MKNDVHSGANSKYNVMQITNNKCWNKIFVVVHFSEKKWVYFLKPFLIKWDQIKFYSTLYNIANDKTQTRASIFRPIKWTSLLLTMSVQRNTEEWFRTEGITKDKVPVVSVYSFFLFVVVVVDSAHCAIFTTYDNNILISKALLTNTEFPRGKCFTWRSRKDLGVLKEDTGRKKFYRKEFYMTMPRAESFTVTKARGKRFTERYREKTVLHDNSRKKDEFFTRQFRQENVLHDDPAKNAFFTMMPRGRGTKLYTVIYTIKVRHQFSVIAACGRSRQCNVWVIFQYYR